MESSVNGRKNTRGLGIHRVYPGLTEVAELKGEKREFRA